MLTNDIIFANHNSLFLMTPCTDAGRVWISKHINGDAQTWGNSVVVEPRYVEDIMAGAVEDGLSVGVR